MKIGFIGVRPDAADYSAKFIVRELENLGYVEGNGFHFEYRTADNQIDRLPDLVDQLIRLKIDVLITAATPETKMAQKATKDIPIVSLNLGDPVISGLVNSMARPGGNVTGFTPLSVELTSKRLELLKESIPKISRVAVIFNPETTRPETWKPSWGESQRVAKQLGLEIRSIEMKTAGELDGTFADIIKARTNGLVVSQSALTNSLQRKIVKLAATHKLPTIYPRRDYAESGGLMSYGADRNEAYTRVAIMVDKILKGSKPAAIPVEQASKFELICNLKTAKQIGVTIPPNVLARADRVIK
ncbi:MAG TPA: ABC transporter substrate-binding protein [Pyrinomonadaceae bacterium]|nr:ABC transporter substrate-binding protein [Pyrinomonadaceae bacterium]